jgi:RNA polymerase sigma factor (sigma-70 family)
VGLAQLVRPSTCKPCGRLARLNSAKMSTMGMAEAQRTRVHEEVEHALTLYGSEMFGLAMALTANAPDAEDAYQTAWARALSHWDQIQDPVKRRSWLASITWRSALTIRRRHRFVDRWHSPLQEGLDLSRAMDSDPTLGEAIARLSTRQRAVVALHYGHGYTLDEVASILHTRAGTVRSHLSRALAHLRLGLEDD